MAEPVQRSPRLRLAITGLALVGLLVALIIEIIFIISLFFKSQTYVSWTLFMWFLFVWVAIGVSVAIMLQPARGRGTTVEILASVAWLIALVFAFAGAGFTIVIWARCQFNTGSLDQAETVICSGAQRWVLWFLLFFTIILLLMTVVGFAIHFYDYFAPRLDSIRALLPIPVGQNGAENGDPAESEESYRRSGFLLFAIAFVGIFGLLLALGGTIIFLVTVGIKDITFVTWLYNPLYIPFWGAAAISTLTIFLPTRKNKGALEVGAIVAWLLAFALAIAGLVVYSIIWVNCNFKKGGLTAGEQTVCDNELWLVWILWFFSIWAAIHSLVGTGVHIWDFVARRRLTTQGLLGSLGIRRGGETTTERRLPRHTLGKRVNAGRNGVASVVRSAGRWRGK